MLTPALNSFGTFTVLAPFVLPVGEYRCTAITGITSLLNIGIDVFSTYYSANGLSDQIYTNDVLDEVPIVTLTAADGTTLILPSSYISTVPDTQSVPYSNFYFVVDLGKLPNDIAVTQVKADIVSLVDDALGISSLLVQAVNPDSTLHTYAAHLTLDAARQLQINRRVSDKQARRLAEQRVIEYQQRITDLEAIIVSLS
jgi:hypothetical protein